MVLYYYVVFYKGYNKDAQTEFQNDFLSLNVNAYVQLWITKINFSVLIQLVGHDIEINQKKLNLKKQLLETILSKNGLMLR